MKVFITGITGLLGRHIALKCAQQGHEVTALIRNKKIGTGHFNHELKICHGDILSKDTLTKNMEGAEIVIHCAADTSMQTRTNEFQDRVNIEGIRNLIEASKKSGIKRFIHISSATTFVSGNDKQPADESVRLTSSPSRLPYINSKIRAEEILMEEFKTNQFPVIILNPTFILGPEDYKINSGKLIFSAIKKKIFVYPTGGKNIVDARDIADVTVNAISSGRTGENYLICNENLSYREIFTMACNLAKVPPPKIRLPYVLGNMVGHAGTLIEVISGKPLPINRKTMKISFENHYFRADKAKKELGFNPRPAAETIRDTVNWFMANPEVGR